MSKPVLYTFGASVWAAAPELALIELGYTDDKIIKKVVNLVEGENFAPSFLNINPKGTLPTLEADGRAYTSTAEVTSYLVKHAPRPAAPGTPFIAKLHDDKYDPNFPLLLARNDAELEAKASGFPFTFVQNRQNALEKHSSAPEGADHKEFYDTKVSGNGDILAVYQDKASEEQKNGFFETSTKHWEVLNAFILDELPGLLPDDGFLGGEKPGEDDFHLGAWLARIAFVAGGGDENGVTAMEKELGEVVPQKVARYWAAWSERQSWKTVYASGLH
ncbi:hypothetical protein BV22DRAFT_1065965 [Leucogyrophana mollusca]|uniref:Uncharacterized protein n=1 Tax=Leucogyrophana mollusca TaxID=85980 RepID=A0ACB8BH99_9AGAM|nr:hypothetical protein BV22DRAFT_1065965 [Leucogyrophana mollusca]